MDYVWDALYDVGLTSGPSVASVPIFPQQCQRDLYQNYQVDPEIIGEGSFGCIRRVKLLRKQHPGANGSSDDNAGSNGNRIYNRWYACKTISKSKLNNRELLRREVYNLNRCQAITATTDSNSSSSSNSNNNNNNCVIRLLDVIEDRYSVHMVTELCEGGELFDYVRTEHDRTGRGLRGKALSPSTTLSEAQTDGDETRCATILHQILTAFILLHERADVCHRDAKASNFVFVQRPSFVEGSLALRVIDFGLSKFVGRIREEDEEDSGGNRDNNSAIEMPNGAATETNHNESVGLWGTLKATFFSEQPETRDCSTTDDDTVGVTMAGSEETSGETKTTPDKTETKDTTNGDSREDSLYAKHYRYMTSEVGTPYYVAPEVLKQQQQKEQQEQHDEHEQHPTLSSQGNSDRIDRGYTTKCDIWSIGVLAYFTLTGTLPVMGDDERETVQKLMDPKLQVDFSDETVWEQDDFAVDDNGTTHPTSEGTRKKPPRISKAARKFCKALLQRDPNKRPTAREALQFEWIVKHCGESTLTPELVSPSDPSMARKRAPLPLLGTACGESGGRK